MDKITLTYFTVYTIITNYGEIIKMRMRKKKNGAKRLENLSALFIAINNCFGSGHYVVLAFRKARIS